MLQPRETFACLLQYCHRPEREEGVNVGVVVIRTGTASVVVRIDEDLSAVTRALGLEPAELDWLRRHLAEEKNLLESSSPSHHDLRARSEAPPSSLLVRPPRRVLLGGTVADVADELMRRHVLPLAVVESVRRGRPVSRPRRVIDA